MSAGPRQVLRRYSGQVLTYTRMLEQLQGAGDTTTLAHYLGQPG